MVLAMNAAPWGPFNGVTAFPYADKMGLMVTGGILVSPSFENRPSFIVKSSGKFAMQGVHPDSLDGISFAVSGFGFCLKSGQTTARDTILHPRTGYGIDSAGRYLYVIVVDGRQTSSYGATVQELGHWLQFFGAYQGLNMDGGGSSTLVGWSLQDTSARLLNHPSGSQRANGNNLGIWIDPSTSLVSFTKKVHRSNRPDLIIPNWPKHSIWNSNRDDRRRYNIRGQTQNFIDGVRFQYPPHQLVRKRFHHIHDRDSSSLKTTLDFS